MGTMTYVAFGLAALFLVLFVIASGKAGQKGIACSMAQNELKKMKDDDRRQRDIINSMKNSLATMEKDHSERSRVFMVLLELARTLGGSLEKEKLPMLLIRIAQQLFDCEEAIFFKPGDDGGDLTVAEFIGLDPKLAQEIVVKVGDGYVGHTAGKRVIMTKEDFENESNLIKQKLENTRDKRINPTLCIPLVQRNNLMAVVSLGRIQRRSKEERNLMLIFQSLGSMALDNAGLFEKLYTKDKLTGLLNRRYFDERALAELNRAKRFGHKLSFALMDLDNFKTFLETNGTQAGDRVLARIGQLLNEHVRKIDISCRMDEDKFAAALLETEKGQALQFAEKIKKIVDYDNTINDQAFTSQRLTISMAVMTFPDDGMSYEQIFRDAAQKLHEVQTKGGNVIISDIGGGEA
jgi:diguanylate cyclase (GGDEF)-like protein